MNATRGPGHAQAIQRGDSDGREMVKGKRLDNEEDEIRLLLGSLDDEVRVVLEAGSNWHWMCDLLDEMGLDNELCHPLKTRAIASAGIKTDKLDAGILAHLGRMDFVPEAYRPDMATRYLKGAPTIPCLCSEGTHRHHEQDPCAIGTSERGQPVQRPVREKGTGPSRRTRPPAGLQAGVGRLHQAAWRARRRDKVKAAEGCVEAVRANSREVKLLETIPGVGPVLVLTILADMGDVSRFHSVKRLASFAGLIPSTSQSGSSTWHGQTTRAGSSCFAHALVEAAIHASTKPGPVMNKYLALKERKGNKIARVTVARRLTTCVCHMLKEGKNFGEVVSYGIGDLG